MLRTLLLLMSAAVWASIETPPTAADVDLRRYMGTWYEIAAVPNRLQRGCTDTVVNYRRLGDGRIELLNTCWKNGKYRPFRGKGKVLPDSNGAKWKVNFYWIVRSPYWVIERDEDYRWAVVGTPDREKLWIISREREFDAALLSRLIEKMRALGYPVDGLEFTEHTGKRFPGA
jgi:apolipoprotein D and lipocalin family protein